MTSLPVEVDFEKKGLMSYSPRSKDSCIIMQLKKKDQSSSYLETHEWSLLLPLFKNVNTR